MLTQTSLQICSPGPMHAPSLSESESESESVVVVVPLVVVVVPLVASVVLVVVPLVASVVLDEVASVSEVEVPVEVPVAEVEDSVPELVDWPLVLDIDPLEVSDAELWLPPVASLVLLTPPISSPAQAIVVRPTSAEIRKGALPTTNRCGVAQNGQ